MKAARIAELGPPDNIAIVEVATPTPSAGEVLMHVEYAAVNHVDTFVRSGAWRTPCSMPLTIGRDAAGTISDVGAAAADLFTVGERVWTNSVGYAGRDGALAEYIAVAMERVFRTPPGIDSAAMAAIAHPGSTAHLALFKYGELHLSDHVVVVGAGGNIGMLAVQLAHFAGAKVTAVARNRHHNRLGDLGADAVVEFDDLTESALGSRANLFIDCAGVNDLERYCSLAARDGRIVLIAGMGTAATVPVGAIYLNGLHITGFAISNASLEDLQAAARGLSNAVEHHKLVAPDIILRGLSEVADAHRELESGRVSGKLVIEVQPTE